VTVRDLPQPPMPDQVVTQTERRSGKWIWMGGILALGVIAAILFIILRPGASASSGFVLVVKGAPAGSQIFINDVLRDAVSGDGALKVSGINPGQVNVRVSYEGLTDYMTVVSGKTGETQTCEAQLLPEIEYNGAMVPIPAGEFTMGDDGHADEHPAHNVNLPSYYIDKYEVSNAQYKKFCVATGRTPPPDPPFEPNYFNGKPTFPVLGTTLADALAYAEWAGKRLPTEEEWEKAASWDRVARRKRRYPWGDEFTSDRANIAKNHPVSTTEATGDLSPYGVYHMAGNAGEWTMTAWQPYEGNKSPNLSYSKDETVMRGGTFLQGSTSDEARTSYRNHLPVVFPKGFAAPVGIRCVVPADDTRIQPQMRTRGK